MILSKEEKFDSKTKAQLLNLWKEVFFDEEDYIKLIFPYLEHIDVVCKKVKDEIVSSFYLLDCEINFHGKTYKGKNLYAAATKPRFRNQGVMSELLREGIEFCKEKWDFIFLTPADEGLYSYYERFGFKKGPYRYETKLNLEIREKMNPLSNFETVKDKRSCFTSDSLEYSKNIFSYVFDCYEYFGTEFFESERELLLYSKNERTVLEYLFDGNINNSSLLRINEGDEYIIFSKNKLGSFSEKKSYGMIKSFCSALEKAEIYNNLAID